MIPTNITRHKNLLSEGQLAELLTVSVAALRRWRLQKRGPKYIKLGTLVRYRLSDIELWLATRPSGGDCTDPKRSIADAS